MKNLYRRLTISTVIDGVKEMSRRFVSHSDGGQSYLDRILDALNHPHRRRLLYCLRETDPMDIEDAAKRIAADELDTVPDRVPDSEHKRILASIYHGHVPRLTQLGIVDYDRRSGSIRLHDPPEELQQFLNLAQSLDEEMDQS